MIQTIPSLLKTQADRLPTEPAILASGQSPLTYAGLWKFADSLVSELRSLGIAPDDRVAIVLPNGPEMAVSFLSVSCAAAAAPLNPAYREKEFDFYLSDLDARAVIVQRGVESPVREVAKRRGIAVFEIDRSAGHLAGEFDLYGYAVAPSADRDFAGGTHTALVLHTSGTTSRPKMVPLTHENICRSAKNIAESLRLTREDRCLNVMPLFHIHGLVGAISATLFAGGSAVCSAGFDVDRFYGQLAESRPTWYTAVPTMHQAVLGASGQYGDVVSKHQLRFIRSCSSALPPSVMAQLGDTFGVPVVEAYGMTEAAHQIACNPLPPSPCKPSSVGVATGVEVLIMDEAGNRLSPGETGEVVIRGVNVTLGYANNEEANEQSFTDGWFRTGDQGHFDSDGYLFLTGRLKEMINRGGENISPREIDDVLLEHPKIGQAITFAVPHPTLGENVAAAVVLEEGASLAEQDVRTFVAEHVSEFKVPQRVLFLDQIPKGPTGKPQRIGLAEKLGLASGTAPSEVSSQAPVTEVEQSIRLIWERVLSVTPVGRESNFFELGGDSLRAIQMLNHVQEELHVEISIAQVFEYPALMELSHCVSEQIAASESAVERRMAG